MGKRLGEDRLISAVLAERIGINKAHVFGQVHFWMKYTNVEKDGEKWVKFTQKEWVEQLPWLSRPTFQRAIYDLKELGLIRVKLIGRNRALYGVDYNSSYLLGTKYELHQNDAQRPQNDAQQPQNDVQLPQNDAPYIIESKQRFNKNQAEQDARQRDKIKKIKKWFYSRSLDEQDQINAEAYSRMRDRSDVRNPEGYKWSVMLTLRKEIESGEPLGWFLSDEEFELKRN